MLGIARGQFCYGSDVPDDSAQEFVLLMLAVPRVADSPLSVLTEHWITFQAYAFVHRTKERLRRLHSREVSGQVSLKCLERLILNAPSRAPGPDLLTQLADLEAIVVNSAAHLTPLQQSIILEVYFRQKSIQEISRETGDDVHVLSQRLVRARRSLLVVMKRAGVTISTAELVLNDLERARV